MKDAVKKMESLFGKWGPFSKKYSGISRIVDHESEEGVRFDCVVSPAIENADSRVPNVTVPVGVHPWEAKSDYSFYSYRYDLEWKDRVYADVSFTRLSPESVLVRTEFVNNTEMKQICLLNLFSAIEYPGVRSCRPVLPEKCIFIKALDYDSYEYTTPRPWDAQCADALKKGEFFDGRFTFRRGLGDRVGRRGKLPQYPAFGKEAGDCVTYHFDCDEDYENPVLFIRYRTPGGADSRFAINGKETVFPASEDMAQMQTGVQLRQGTNELRLVSLGAGALELDFLAVAEKGSAVETVSKKHDYYPEINEEVFSDGSLVSYQYEGVGDRFYVRTFNGNTRYRSFDTGCLEDSPTARVSQPDESFRNMLETFSGSFSKKHSDEGFYHNAVVHSLYIQPYARHVEYAVLSFGAVEYLTVEEYEGKYQQALCGLEGFGLNAAGQAYEFSNKILRATMLQNVVYPLYYHGEYILHHTPGKRWDSFYTWDAGFVGLGMVEFAPQIADYILDLYLSDSDNQDFAFLLHGSPVPVHIYQFLESLKRAGDKAGMLRYYSRVKLFYDFLAGKINGSTTAKFKSGMTTTFDYFYNCSSMDDLPPQKAMHEQGLARRMAPVISTSQVIRSAKLLYMAADLLGREEDKTVYLADIEHLGAALQAHSWDEECGYFSYVLHDERGNPVGSYRNEQGENLNKTLDGIYPLIAGAVTEGQRGRILSHLKSESELWSPIGISAVDQSASYYKTNGYWNGNVWMAHQWFVWKTMLDLGETDFAFKIAKTALDVWKREVEYSYYTYEMFNIETGRGGWFHNFGGLSSPVNIWADAYYKKGTLSTGLETMVLRSSFDSVCRVFSCELKYYGDNRAYSVLVVMDDSCDYEVLVNGEKAQSFLREKGTCEITLPGACKHAAVSVTAKQE
ncbi:MAG: hypothetical protein LBS36_13380 [Oscillospiraceae bacterium]|jgi:hypothetical protein|nr:hypothetical protein [Oscillospiraceae bacterium]